jgi:ribosomal protein L7Ae-like RNA K-turn-binding protein
MGLKKELTHSLRIAIEEVESALLPLYPSEMVSLIKSKMTELIQNLNFNTHKKSIAMYISPVFQKILYLDIPVETKIIIDKSFEIRDLVYSKKQLHKYLVLLLNEKQSRIFLGNTESFLTLVTNGIESVSRYMNDMPERVANFSDVSKTQEILMDKFIRYIDNGLSHIIHAYPLPLFVMGPKKMTGHFKKLTRHSVSVVDYVQKDIDSTSIPEIRKALIPHIHDWEKVMQKNLLKQLEEAADKGKLATGMKDVWKEAMAHKGRLLVIEKNFTYAAEKNSEDKIYKAVEPYNKYSYIKDAVDEVIEKVLESGGDVEFVDNNVLTGYHQIALIMHFG